MATTKASAPFYFVDLLPKTQPISPTIISKFKTLRLEYLLHIAALSSVYAREAAFTEERWIAEITDPVKHILVCHTGDASIHDCTSPKEDSQSNSNDGYTKIKKSDWVGMLILQGPFARPQYSLSHFPTLDPPLGSDECETRWHLSGLYLQPAHRCADSAVAMHEAILSSLREWTDEALPTAFDEVKGAERMKRARVAGFVWDEDSMLQDMYRALGGKEVGVAGWDFVRSILGMKEEGTIGEEMQDRDEGMGVLMQGIERVIEC